MGKAAVIDRNNGRQSVAAIRRCLLRGELEGVELGRYLSDPRVAVRRLVEQARRRRQHEAAETQRLAELSALERLFWSTGVRFVAGVDEVGMGPLAGPVVAAAVIFRPGTVIRGIDDSKRLSPKRRVELSAEIRRRAVAFAIGRCSPKEIDRLNIYQAGREAMRRAVKGLALTPEHVLVDARRLKIEMAQTAVIKGDSRSQSIAGASIIAKVERDRWMDKMAKTYPGYGFAQHHGYPTRAHLEALARLGPTPIHRRSFEPVKVAAVRGP